MSHFHASYNLDYPLYLSLVLSIYSMGEASINDAIFSYFPYFKIVLYVYLHSKLVHSDIFVSCENIPFCIENPFSYFEKSLSTKLEFSIGNHLKRYENPPNLCFHLRDFVYQINDSSTL